MGDSGTVFTEYFQGTSSEREPKREVERGQIDVTNAILSSQKKKNTENFSLTR